MAWCCQATSRYLSQCRPWPMSPYGVTRPQYVIAWHKPLCLLVKRLWLRIMEMKIGALHNMGIIFVRLDTCDEDDSGNGDALQWRHNGRGGVSNHQPHDCLLSRLFGRRSKKTSKLRVTGLCAGNSPGPVYSPHKWPVTRKMFSFDDVIIGVDGDDGMWLMVSLVVLVFHVGVFGSSGGIGDVCSICCRHRAFVQTRNAPIPYPTVHHFLTEMCTGVHISVTKCCIVWYFSDALWDLWHGFIILGHIISRVSGKRVASRFRNLFH